MGLRQKSHTVPALGVTDSAIVAFEGWCVPRRCRNSREATTMATSANAPCRSALDGGSARRSHSPVEVIVSMPFVALVVARQLEELTTSHDSGDNGFATRTARLPTGGNNARSRHIARSGFA